MSSPISLQSHVDSFRAVRPLYDLLGDILTAALRRATRDLGMNALVGARTKTLASFAGKIVRKAGKYHDPVGQLTDLCGARVITESLDEIAPVCAFIREHFLIDEANSEDTFRRLRDSEFSYRSVHFIVSLRPDAFASEIEEVLARRAAGRPEVRAELESQLARLLEQRSENEAETRGLPPGPVFKAEVQVRTLLQHTWACIYHDRVYKTEIEVPAGLKRDLHRVAAVLESADNTFAEAVRRIQGFASYFGASRSAADLANEQAVLALSPGDREQAVRVAHLLATLDRWPEVRTLLAPFAAAWEETAEAAGSRAATAAHDPANGPDLPALLATLRAPRQATPGTVSLLVDYGRALIETGCPEEGRRLLARALRLAPERVEIALFLGGSFEGSDDDTAFGYYHAAYQVAPQDPWVLCRYLGKAVVRTDAAGAPPCPLALLDAAIERCREETEVRINLPRAWFNWAFLLLASGQREEAMVLYCRAALGCLPDAAANSGHRAVLENALGFLRTLLRRLSANRRELPGLDTAVRLLALVHAARFLPVAERAAALQPFRLAAPAFEGVAADRPVLMVAGSTTPPDPRLGLPCDLLNGTLVKFRGTLVSGGTRSGISALVGDLPFPTGAAERIACLPSHLSAATERHPAYRTAATSGRGFSSLEPVQLWIELVARGVDPSTVRLLGVGGGAIARVEYTLAAVLGAQVALLRGSGRSADAVLDDPDWSGQPNVLALPHDRETLACFVAPASPTAFADPAVREALARELHENHRDERLRAAAQSAPETRPWEELPDALRNSNRACIDHIAAKLHAAGYRTVPLAPGEAAAFEFPPEHVEMMAEMEHGRWVAERLLAGWKLGAKDTARKRRPTLVAWSELPEDEIAKDRATVRAIPALLARAGLRIEPAAPAT